jgi:hypothetical protein
MKSYRLQDILPSLETVDAYLTYRYIEEWCHTNLSKERWRFDYSSTICAHGVDIPGRIFFWKDEDAVAFRLQYRVISPGSST